MATEKKHLLFIYTGESGGYIWINFGGIEAFFLIHNFLYKKQDEEKNEKRENVFFELDGNIA